MLSLRHDFLFVHIPKTGGNSVQNLLRDYSSDEIVVDPDKGQDGVHRFNVRNKETGLRKHAKLAQYQAGLDPDVYARLFKFATLRNPWARMVSNFFSPHQGVTEWQRDAFVAFANKKPTLREFISTDADRPLGSELDVLMRFEHLAADFETVCGKIGIPHRPLPVVNASKSKHYSHYYDDELVETVRARFAEEIALGGYVFERA